MFGALFRMRETAVLGTILLAAVCTFELLSYNSFQRIAESQSAQAQNQEGLSKALIKILATQELLHEEVKGLWGSLEGLKGAPVQSPESFFKALQGKLDGLKDFMVQLNKSMTANARELASVSSFLTGMNQTSTKVDSQRLYSEEALRWTTYLLDVKGAHPVPAPENRDRLSATSGDITPSGMFNIPASIKRVWIDVGADWSSFLGDSGVVNYPFGNRPSLREQFSKNEDIFAIAIEANAAYYTQLKALPRIIPLPIAMSNQEGVLLFREYAGPGCSSLLDPETDTITAIPDACKQVKAVHHVPSLRLERIINMIPGHLPIQVLKVDAQGVDVDVVKSGGAAIRRVEKMIIEVQIPMNGTKSNMLYKGSNTKQQALDYLSTHGFVLNEKESYAENPGIAEENLVFDRV